MSTLLLAPYNDSMRLGQGYNSFLQLPCLGNAVGIDNEVLVGQKKFPGQSQTVSYSSSFVEKISEVVRSMNISAGSSIMTGSVAVSGGGSSVDEIKFAESDLNAVFSAKVVNQTRTLRDNVKFNIVKIANMTSAKFHQVYGDCYISGFIEGGDLHGIVSIKALDASRKQEIKSALRSQFNGSQQDWSPAAGGTMTEALRHTEVTVTVNWSGGGTIKPSGEEWTIESLVRAASSFPEKVAKCPQRTWAILTRYDTIPNFVEHANSQEPPISVQRYEGIQRYTSELLDMYIEYKYNLLIVNDAIRHPDKYQISLRPDFIDVTVDDLVKERKKLKREMVKIVKYIEDLNANPTEASKLQLKDDIQEPELWRARLPMRKERVETSTAQVALDNLISGIPIVTPASSQASTSSSLNDAISTAGKLQGVSADLEETQKTLQTTSADLQTEKQKSTRVSADLEETQKTLQTTSADLQTEKQKSTRVTAELEDQKQASTTLQAAVDKKAEELRVEKLRAAELEKCLTIPVKSVPYDENNKLPTPITQCAITHAVTHPEKIGDFFFAASWVTGAAQATVYPQTVIPIETYLDINDIPSCFTLWHNTTYIRSVTVDYQSGKTVQHGNFLMNTRTVFKLEQNDNILAVRIESHTKREFGGNRIVDGLTLVSNRGKALKIMCPDEKTGGDELAWIAPTGYRFLGFWSQSGSALDRLGVIWARIPSKRKQGFDGNDPKADLGKGPSPEEIAKRKKEIEQAKKVEESRGKLLKEVKTDGQGKFKK
ncbi:hypothetical protein MMC18_001361 [Xylographa bjoerkii]|nr:hypothetical protein [Xylographa bjoerkii]